MTDNHWLIRGAKLLGRHAADVRVSDGRYAQIGNGLAAEGATVVDAQGLVLLPGLVDLHTHLREPGREDAETVLSGTQAAARGGYTAVCAMANSQPVADTAGVVEQVWRLGQEAGYADVQPIGAVSIGLQGETMAELGTMNASKAHVRMFSDDGHCVSDPQLMRRALEYVKTFDGLIAQHAEEPRLTQGAQMHEGELSSRLGLAGWPAVAEEAIIARDVLLADYVGSRVHFCHVSTAGSVDIIAAAKRKGINVTAEVCPHHLLLTDERVASYDPVFKVNPPLRESSDVAALRTALAEGIIDAVATDHAPHAEQDKTCEWAHARPGMLGLETALSITVEALGGPDNVDWDIVAERCSRTPARIAGLDDHGHDPEVGQQANFTLIDPTTTWTVVPDELSSIARNTPFAGLNLPCTVQATFLRGEATVLDGKLTDRSQETA
ncbi:dihydroorotase [Natronoglycomyces albus]|uniref:Dihydroorotase n=1 Tax=Natronoglycomyces albus TaxID=2811108 RepID=A0A895XSZ2_9ACTN|nr:dihydroorotase [Natronoglycomyces albus]QSB06613.1 dihydroorotase [Natronoglycomyces albus]